MKSIGTKNLFQRVQEDGKSDFFSRNNTMADLGSEVRREVTAGIARVPRIVEHLESRDNSSNTTASVSNSANNLVPETDNQRIPENAGNNHTSGTNVQALCPASSGAN
ncbi:E3 ubiquitin-protein ligase RHF2A [Melia azedarach]|uniref:E3 ubiquitin-protein ligase RHF2A n=1 Tax=Melia azedarach TaxID=155640 RepID=A0ACC1YMB7_MELAZ|nr:E3 ubiquitin-protein ligase RHF2A [Melia azedarach]